MTDTSRMFAQALLRPATFDILSGEEQWAIDKSLGILDWEGDCSHKPGQQMCGDCCEIYKERSK